MTSRSTPRTLPRLLALALGALLVSTGVSHAQTHPPGTDHWTHTGGPPVPDEADFSSFPLPAGFFAPGSDPFSGVVSLHGTILGPGDADTSVRRLAGADLPPPFPVVDTIPIELVQLNLVSVNPMTVTYGGGSPEPWNVKFCTQPPPPNGTMDVRKAHPNGGTFTSTFFVQPVFTFTRVQDGAIRNLPTTGTIIIQGPWSEVPVPNGVSTGPNLYPGDCTLDFIESGSASTVVRGGIAPAVSVPVPTFSWGHTLALVGLVALGGAALFSRRVRAV